MARYNQDLEDLGRNIQEIVDRAVKLHDYQKLNQTINQVIDKAIDRSGEAVRKAMDGAARTTYKTTSTTTRKTTSTYYRQESRQQVVVQNEDLPVLYARTGSKTAAGIAKLVGGSLLSAFSLLLFLAGIVLMVTSASLMPTLISLGGIGGGVWLICSGIGTLNRVTRFKTYCKTLGQKTHCTLEKLAQSVGKSVKYVRKELQQMIREGLFLQGHMDKEETRLITSHETYRQFEQSRLQLEERQRLEAAAREQKQAAQAGLSPQVQEVLDRGDAYIAQIRKCNDDIPGVEISEKISRIELTVQHIFDRAEAHPEIIPDLKKMMDYYLPMTVKLLQAYADMDAQPVQGETILNSKREIEATLDTLNVAFEKLLDSVFQDTAMDVSSDISVLNTLLAQEGLTEDDFSKIKNSANKT